MNRIGPTRPGIPLLLLQAVGLVHCDFESDFFIFLTNFTNNACSIVSEKAQSRKSGERNSNPVKKPMASDGLRK
jgi:hypothetical protein